MQNAPAMLAQKMMNRQAAYAPVGMVSQNMSGNKKGVAAGPSGPVIGLKFDTATATAGLTFADSNTTVTNTTGGAIASAKGNASIVPNAGNYWYWEFTVGATNAVLLGFGLPTFVCDNANRIGFVANSIGYIPSNGNVYANSLVQTTIATALVGDVIGFQLDVFAATSALTITKNGIAILSSYNTTTWIPNYSTAWTPIYSSNQTSAKATISNNIYSYAGYTPIGTAATTVAASASVPAVADGAYDVYTFNASGTFTALSTGAVRALVIAGGGGGGSTGGGGAGGYKENGATVTPQTYTVTVGGGGGFLSANGTSSSLGALISTTGGGSGTAGAGAVGGSGSGGSPSIPGPNTVAGGAGTAGQGNAGGQGNSVSATLYGGGGGGGAGSVGGAGNAGSNGLGGNGGTGKTSDINGTSVGRGGGGGAYGYLGNGTTSNGGQQGSGTSNTGGGGGWNSGSGGSGIVIIRVRARA